MLCALVLLALASCSRPTYDPAPIDDRKTPDPARPAQHAGDGAGGEEPAGDGGPPTPVPADHPALETVRAWVRAETAAYRGDKRDRLRTLASPGCRPCERSLRSISRVYADGGQLRDRYTQTITFIQGVTGTNPPVVQTIIERSARVLLDADGDVRKRIPASTELLEFRTAKEGTRWLIIDIVSADR